MNGFVCLVLHAHLPFVRHPEEPRFLEEDWLFEAVAETYLPLLEAFRRLREQGVPFRLTMSFSPSLCEMLADPLLQQRCSEYLGRLRELSEKEFVRTSLMSPFRAAAELYRDHFSRVHDLYENGLDRNILGAFADLQASGHLEIMTCAATHAFLPHVLDSGARRAQIQVAVRNHEKHFGRRPRGIWLPECAYVPGLDRDLAEAGLSFFFLDAHGLLHASRVPKYGLHAPCETPSGVAVFARDIESSRQVWSAHEGYPGDPAYREFYRDLGFDADYDVVRPYLHPDGVRRNLGLKYHRITGDVPLDGKQPYDPVEAAHRAEAHAGNFMFNRQHQVLHLRSVLGREPVIVAPYDAELFGHWWFEGPQFLESLFRRTAFEQQDYRFAVPPDVLRGPIQRLTPSASSWGDKGYSEVWLNASNDWIYRHQHRAESRMAALARDYPDAEGRMLRALNQAARELLLSQSSDWAFLMSMGTAVPYAQRRFREHTLRFTTLHDQVRAGGIDEKYLSDLEWRDSIFQELDYRVYA